MRSAILTLALVLLAAAPAAAQQDLRSPDSRDAADRPTQSLAPEAGLPAFPTPSARSHVNQDLRSPDARDAAAGRGRIDAPQVINQDLRSPDARDAAAGRGTFDAPQVTVVKLPQPAPLPAGGIDWADAGMGAAIVLLLSAAGVVAVVVRRRTHPQTAISA